MSNLQTRQALATAASTVEGIHCTPYVRQTTKAGDAMVRLDRINYPNAFGGVVTWQVWVVLPQDVQSAEKYLDSKVPPLVTALAEEMVVASVTPGQLALDTDVVLGVSIEGTREEN
jgi:hypothetical protein